MTELCLKLFCITRSFLNLVWEIVIINFATASSVFVVNLPTLNKLIFDSWVFGRDYIYEPLLYIARSFKSCLPLTLSHFRTNI